MYAVAATLDPDSYFALARATYREMVAAGITSVGEFHYLHHRPDGTPYDDPNAMGHALVEAAGEAGIRIALLDTCYLSSGFGAPVEGVQVPVRRRRRRRLGGAGAPSWTRSRTGRRPGRRRDPLGARRAARPARTVAAAAPAAAARPPLRAGRRERRLPGGVRRHPDPAARRRRRCSARCTTAVHATHLTDDDVALLGRDAAPAPASAPPPSATSATASARAARCTTPGARLTLGSDSHAVIDLFEEMRGRGARRAARHPAARALDGRRAARRPRTDGHASLGFGTPGGSRSGARADLVTLDTASARTAGTGADEHTAVFAATAEDVTQVVVDGRVVVRAG